jgi:drug/metabolite transporter (DMT)-like permease
LSPLFGVFLKLISALFLTMMAAAIKSVSTRYPIGEIVFARSFFALIPLLIWLAWRAELPAALKTKNLRSHLKRGIMGSSSMFTSFAALQFLPLSEAVAIGYAAPLAVVVLAALVLKERVRIYRWSAVTIGFVGVIIMLSPHLGTGTRQVGGDAAIGAALALASAFFSAFSAVEVRILTQTERTGAIVFYFMMLTSLLGLSTIVLGWTMPGLQDGLLLVVIGILGGLGQILVVQAYRYGDASLIAPFEYSTMLWAIAIGWFWFGEWPASAILIGATIVIASGIYVILREHRLGLARREQREVGTSR